MISPETPVSACNARPALVAFDLDGTLWCDKLRLFMFNHVDPSRSLQLTLCAPLENAAIPEPQRSNDFEFSCCHTPHVTASTAMQVLRDEHAKWETDRKEW
jgi:hypothetical protein